MQLKLIQSLHSQEQVYLVFGQKTLQTKASALDRVNVRRLLIELKKFIGDQAKKLSIRTEYYSNKK
jgi:hypothetical protein